MADEQQMEGEDGGAAAPDEAEYVFDGYQVDFSRRVALTPPTVAAKPGWGQS
jgi:hypothetical protein